MKFRLFSSAAAVCALLGACAVDVPVDDFAEVDSVSAAICAGGLPDCQAQCQCAFKTEYEAKKMCLEACVNEDDGGSNGSGGAGGGTGGGTGGGAAAGSPSTRKPSCSSIYENCMGPTHTVIEQECEGARDICEAHWGPNAPTCTATFDDCMTELNTDKKAKSCAKKVASFVKKGKCKP